MAFLTVEKRGRVAIVTMNRPDKLNALPEPGDGEEFARVFGDLGADASIGCVVLSGAGRAFSAGGDVKAMRARADLFEGSGVAIRERYRRVVHRIVRALYELEVPLVAAVNGPAVGIGCDIVGLADIRLASDEAKFGVPFLKLGIIPGDGGAWLLPRTIGYARAAELLFTGELIDAETAERWGMINRIVPGERLLDEAVRVAEAIATQAPHSIRLAKALLRQGREASYEAVLEMSASAQALSHLTADHIEGVSAHIEKRKPVFKGK